MSQPPLPFNIQHLLKTLGYGPKPKKREGTFLVKGNMLDDRTMAQLQAQRFSGLRMNELWLRIECWILGRMEWSISYSEFFLRPAMLNEKYAETFGIQPVFDDRTQKDIKTLEERRSLLSAPEVQKTLERLEDPSKEGHKD